MWSSCTRNVKTAGTRGPCRGTAAPASSPAASWKASEAVPAPQGQRCRDPRGTATRGPSPSRQAAGPTHCGVVCSQDPSCPLLMGLTGSTGPAHLESVLKAAPGFTWVWIAPHPIYTSVTLGCSVHCGYVFVCGHANPYTFMRIQNCMCFKYKSLQNEINWYFSVAYSSSRPPE